MTWLGRGVVGQLVLTAVSVVLFVGVLLGTAHGRGCPDIATGTTDVLLNASAVGIYASVVLGLVLLASLLVLRVRGVVLPWRRRAAWSLVATLAAVVAAFATFTIVCFF